MTEGLHHFHKRKRLHQKLEPYPHPNKWKRFLDKIVYFVGIIGPVMTVPQAWKIWYYQEAAGVAAASWGAYIFNSFFWLLYGIAHKERPIIFVYSIWLVLDTLVFIGAIIYG